MKLHFVTLLTCFTCAIASTALAAPVLVAPIYYDGFRTTPDGVGLTSTGGQWADVNGGVRISWDIDLVGDTFTYKYTISQRDGAPLTKGAVSHFLLETSTNFTSSDVLPGSDTVSAPQLWGPSGSNPYIPGNLFGIKFDFGSLNPTYTLVTKRVPIWGDWYAKDGRAGPGESFNTARNASFGSDDQSAPFTGWIPTPDTLNSTPVVPLPAAAWMGLVLCGCIGVGAWQRRRHGHI